LTGTHHIMFFIEVVAVKHGFVEYVHDTLWNSSGFGRFVIIHHDDGNYTRSAHLQAINVKEGQEVSSGDVIGYVGGSGTTEDSYSPHLHFEVMNETCATIQRTNWKQWRFYPSGKDKKWVTQYYLNPWDWIAEGNASEWAREAQEWVIKNNISDGTRPHEKITREESWVMLHRLYTLTNK